MKITIRTEDSSYGVDLAGFEGSEYGLTGATCLGDNVYISVKRKVEELPESQEGYYDEPKEAERRRLEVEANKVTNKFYERVEDSKQGHDYVKKCAGGDCGEICINCHKPKPSCKKECCQEPCASQSQEKEECNCTDKVLMATCPTHGVRSPRPKQECKHAWELRGDKSVVCLLCGLNERALKPQPKLKPSQILWEKYRLNSAAGMTPVMALLHANFDFLDQHFTK